MSSLLGVSGAQSVWLSCAWNINWDITELCVSLRGSLDPLQTRRAILKVTPMAPSALRQKQTVMPTGLLRNQLKPQCQPTSPPWTNRPTARCLTCRLPSPYVCQVVVYFTPSTPVPWVTMATCLDPSDLQQCQVTYPALCLIIMSYYSRLSLFFIYYYRCLYKVHLERYQTFIVLPKCKLSAHSEILKKFSLRISLPSYLPPLSQLDQFLMWKRIPTNGGRNSPCMAVGWH